MKAPKNLFCGNYGACREGWQTCLHTWHPSCYRASHGGLQFKIAVPEIDEGAKWKKTKDLPIFLSACPGDILGTPVQCDHCLIRSYWFVNINKREPEVLSLGDTIILQCIRQVNLDVMWSHESGTVKISWEL